MVSFASFKNKWCKVVPECLDLTILTFYDPCQSRKTKKASTVNLNVKLDPPTVCELAGSLNLVMVLSI